MRSWEYCCRAHGDMRMTREFQLVTLSAQRTRKSITAMRTAELVKNCYQRRWRNFLTLWAIESTATFDQKTPRLHLFHLTFVAADVLYVAYTYVLLHKTGVYTCTRDTPWPFVWLILPHNASLALNYFRFPFFQGQGEREVKIFTHDLLSPLGRVIGATKYNGNAYSIHKKNIAISRKNRQIVL